VFALSTAEGIIAAEQAEHVLVIAAEKLTSIMAGVTGRRGVVRRRRRCDDRPQKHERSRGILSVYLKTDGTLAELLYRPAAGRRIPPSEELLKDHSYYIKMAGREVFKAAVLRCRRL